MNKQFMPIDAYHYDTTGKFIERSSELRIDLMESQIKGRPVPQVPANCTLIAPPTELGKSGHLYFDEERQSWYVMKTADNSEIISPNNPNPPLTPDDEAAIARDAALREMEELATRRMEALNYDPFKSAYRMYLEMYARQWLQGYLNGTKVDPGWLAIVAQGHRMTLYDYCNMVIKRAYSANAGVFKVLALKGKYARLIRGAAAGERLNFVLANMRREIAEVSPESVLSLEDL
jgi:hypothetical protein